MAFDSRERRASAGACGIISLVTLPIPDGGIGAGDRLQLLGLYAGILTAASGPPVSEAQPQAPHGRLIEVAAPFGRLIA